LRGLLGVPLPPSRKTQGTEFIPPPKPSVSEGTSLLEQASPKKEDAEALLHDSPPTEETEEAQSLFERAIHESFPEKSEPKEQSSTPLFEDDGAVPEIPAPKPPPKPTTQPETAAAPKPTCQASSHDLFRKRKRALKQSQKSNLLQSRRYNQSRN
jgi:hypothetical protein